MAYTQADLDAIDRAIASASVQTTDKDGRSMRNDDLAGLIRRRNFIAQQLGATSSSKTLYIQTNKGLGPSSSESP